MITAVRICRDIHAATAMSGEGAKRYGGRWNSPGRPMIYLAGSTALAILEIAVHTDSDGLLLPFVVMDVVVKPAAIEALTPDRLPARWASDLRITRAIGDAWLLSGRSLALRVPSAVVPREFNYLLNPLHPDFGQISAGSPQSIRLDPRIKR